MNKILISILTLCLAALLLFPAAADLQASSKSKKVEEPAEIRHEVALFAVEELDMEQAGKLAEALSKMPGVLAAKPALEEKRLSVEFAAPECDPERILATLETAGATASLIDVKVLEGKPGEKSACDGCPSKSKCGKGGDSS